MSQPTKNGSQRRPEVRKVDFLLRPKFTNNLPDIPFEGKFMNCPFVPLSRFCEYKESTVEKEYKHSVICDDDVGLNIDLIDLGKYDQDEKEMPFDEKDQYLLDDESNSKINMKRSAQHSRLVPWMRKTEYISTEYNRQGVSSDRQETKLGYNLKKNQQVDDMYRDRQSQIDAINKTFEDARKPVTAHYSKKGVHAVEESFIFPDFENWKNAYAYVQFDGETVNRDIPEGLRKTAAELSLIRGMKFEDEQFAALFTPTVENMQKQMEDLEAGRNFEEDERYDYTLNREYIWKLESSILQGDHDNYVFHWKNGEAKYDEVESMVKMTRRRKMYLSKKSKLFVHFRDYDEQELEQMQTKFENLFKPPKKQQVIQEEPEEDEEEDDSEEDEEKKDKSSGSESDDDDDEEEEDSDAKNKKKPAAESSESGSGSDESDSDAEQKVRP
ncbi:unnamed protein product [Caenorhabditis bovis]|uniref:RNA polymerase II-associated factor 1 homolog n=1 Tax=Caenorhabditis bovis TaxID=2654633 RepID=A0A8S1EJX0_9PELO|nr:unnamed protein product [Caenorhabditis bovis]